MMSADSRLAIDDIVVADVGASQQACQLDLIMSSLEYQAISIIV